MLATAMTSSADRTIESGAAAPHAPNGPQLGPRRERRPSPFLVAGAAFAAGTLLAKIVDWRGHAHPKR